MKNLNPKLQKEIEMYWTPPTKKACLEWFNHYYTQHRKTDHKKLMRTLRPMKKAQLYAIYHSIRKTL